MIRGDKQPTADSRPRSKRMLSMSAAAVLATASVGEIAPAYAQSARGAGRDVVATIGRAPFAPDRATAYREDCLREAGQLMARAGLPAGVTAEAFTAAFVEAAARNYAEGGSARINLEPGMDIVGMTSRAPGAAACRTGASVTGEGARTSVLGQHLRRYVAGQPEASFPALESIPSDLVTFGVDIDGDRHDDYVFRTALSDELCNNWTLIDWRRQAPPPIEPAYTPPPPPPPPPPAEVVVRDERNIFERTVDWCDDGIGHAIVCGAVVCGVLHLATDGEICGGGDDGDRPPRHYLDEQRPRDGAPIEDSDVNPDPWGTD